MKKLLIILAAITLLSCEKNELEYKEYNLIVYVGNTLKPGESGVFPKGFHYTYYENGEKISNYGEYVGTQFTMHWNNYQPLKIQANTENDCYVEIKVWREGIDLKEPYRHVTGYKRVEINE